MQESITFELNRGYIDQQGKAHKQIVLRAPTLNDEIVADRMVALKTTAATPEQRAESRSSSLWQLELLASCIQRMGEIHPVTSDHLRKLTRAEGQLLNRKLDELEKQLDGVESDPNSSSGEQGHSSSPNLG